MCLVEVTNKKIFETKRYEIPSSCCFFYLGNLKKFGHIDAIVGSIMMNINKKHTHTHNIYRNVKNVSVVARKKLPSENYNSFHQLKPMGYLCNVKS